jgi:uncharacterized protein
MFVGLQQLELKPFGFDVDIPVGVIDFDNKLKQSSSLHAKGRAELLNASLAEIRVAGDLQIRIDGVCDRCAEPAVYSVADHFDLVYLPAAEDSGDGEKELDGAGLEVGYYDGNGLELNDVFREVVLLALPMQLVCQENCRGICPSCGQNLNQQECGCEPKAADDRWSKLRALRAEIGPAN